MMFLLYGLFAAVCSQGVNILRQHESAEKTVQLKLMGDSTMSATCLNQRCTLLLLGSSFAAELYFKG